VVQEYPTRVLADRIKINRLNNNGIIVGPYKNGLDLQSFEAIKSL